MSKIKCDFEVVVGSEYYYFEREENRIERPLPVWQGTIRVEIEEQGGDNMRAAEEALAVEVEKLWPGMKHTINYWWWLKGKKYVK